MTTVLPNGELQSNPKIAYNKGYEHGRADEQLRSIESAKEQAKEYRVALEKAKADGAREFLAWYSGGETMPSFGRYARCNIDDVIAEWQKGEE